MDRPKLKPCPFCGGAPEFARKAIKTNGAWCDAVYVRCVACDSRTGRTLYSAKLHPNDEEYRIAADSWNKRTGYPCDLCEYGPPGSGDGKPCSQCPASGRLGNG